MFHFRTLALTTLTPLLLAAAAAAQEPIRFARLPDISPDGKLIAFSYLGDLWTVETIGGVAKPVTRHVAHDTYPVFSPDGSQLAFSSNRHGSYDVFVIPVQGGTAKRLTFDSATDIVNSWTPDGKAILFASTRGTSFPPAYELYTIPADGGSVRKIGTGEGREAVYSPKGDQLAYVRGPGTWYRKGYRGSANDDIWICSSDGSNQRQLTRADCQDTSPMWSPDGQFLYYVSEHAGSPANIVRQDAAGKTTPQLMTFHKDDAVRRARLSANGAWIVYECGADLWLASTREGVPPRKLAIEVHADSQTNPETTLTLDKGATEIALSPDERHVVFAVRGELFLMPIQANAKATRLTHSPAYDHGAAWAPDGQKILFLSDRSGHEDVYLLEPNDPEHPKLVEAHHFKVTQLTDTPQAELGLSFAPDGKRVAFVRAGKLWGMNPDGTDQKPIVNDVQVIDYEWSPDSKWIVYARMDGHFASELYIIPAAGPTKENPARNITRYATFNAGVTWSKTGHKLAFLSERRRNTGMHILSLQKPAAAGAPASSDIDWDDIHLRVSALPVSAQEGAISPDGSKVAFRSIGGSSGDDLWVASTSGGQLTRLSYGNARPTHIQWSKRPFDVIYFLDGTGVLRMARPGLAGLGAGSASDRTGSSTSTGSAANDASVAVPFKVKLTIKRDEEYSEMFEQSWRALRDHFYDEQFHGIKWYDIRSKYRPLVKHVVQKEDLYALISLMMGELNASHLGIRGFLSTPDEITADLGLLFDDSHRGPGLKVAEVLKRGPADKRGLNLRPGELIYAIDGTPVTDKTNLSQLLNGKVGETVTLQVLANATADPRDPKARRRVEIQAASRGVVGQPGTIAELMYERWVEKNAQRVAELSKGKLGYIHIPSMDEPGLDRFVRSLYSDNYDKEAIVLDVRYNGGGHTHDQVLNYLGAREHTVFRHRDGGQGPVLRSFDRKWSKPLVLLINNRSYSDAEIFPSAFKTLGLGKVIGQPTGGHVIGTSTVRLIDGSEFRIPRIGVFTVKGVNMEREGVQPDILVAEHPDQLVKGIDVQLDRAVEVLQLDVAEWKKKNAAVAAKPEDAKPPAPGPMGTTGGMPP
jgi:tricorn protease